MLLIILQFNKKLIRIPYEVLIHIIHSEVGEKADTITEVSDMIEKDPEAVINAFTDLVK